MGQRPTSVTRAIQLLMALLVAGLGVTVLVAVFRRDLADAWSKGHPADSAIQPLSFVPVAIVLYVVLALMTLTLISLLRHGHNWARHSLAATVVIIVISTLAVLRTEPPALFVVVVIAAMLLEGLILYYLWHSDTTRFVRGVPEEEDAARS